METTQAYVVVERYRRPDNNTVEQDYWLGPYSQDVARDVAEDYTREDRRPCTCSKGLGSVNMGMTRSQGGTRWKWRY